MKKLAMRFVLISLVPGTALAQDAIDKKIDDDFAKLKTGATSTASTAFGNEANDNWKIPSAFVTNRLVGNAVDYTLTKSELKISFSFPKQAVDIPEPAIVRVQPIEVQCDFCPKCGDLDFVCDAERGLCLAAAWPQISECETIKQASKLADGAKILEIDFKDLELAANASSSGVTARLDDSLNPTVEVQNLRASARLAADLTVQFEDIPGILLACFPYPYPISILPTDVSVNSAAFDVPASLEKKVVEKKINLSLKLHELKPSVNVDGNPFWDVIRANPLFTQTCVIPSEIMKWGALARLLFPISVDIKVKERDIPIPISDVPVPIAGESYSVKYVPTKVAIGIVAERTPAKP